MAEMRKTPMPRPADAPGQAKSAKGSLRADQLDKVAGGLLGAKRTPISGTG